MQKLRFEEGILWDGKKQICNFRPLLISVNKIANDDGTTETWYEVTVKEQDGTIKESKFVQELCKIKFFELFGVADGYLTPKNKAVIATYLQKQAKTVPVIYKKQVSKMGLSEIEPRTFVFDRNCVICNENIDVVCSPIIPELSAEKFSEVEMLEYLSRLLKLMPGVSDVLFIMQIYSILKPVYRRAGIAVDFAGAVIGKPGTYKTSLAKLICTKIDEQVFSFTDYSKREIREAVEFFAGHTVLIDDFHGHKRKNERDKQVEIADTFIRENSGGAFVILTGEFIEGTLSMKDRLLYILAEDVTHDTRERFLKELRWLQSNQCRLWAFYQYFAMKVYTELDAITMELKEDMEIHKRFGATRAEENVKKLATAFNLVCKHCFKGELVRWAEQIEKSICKVEKQSVKYMRFAKYEEYGIDWMEELYKVLHSIYTGEIEPDGECFYDLKDGMIYVRRAKLLALLSQSVYSDEAFSKKVPLNQIINMLDENDIIKSDKGKGHTVKVQGRRHYAIRYTDFLAYRKVLA